MRYVELAARALCIVGLVSMPALAQVYDFEDFAAGQIVGPADLGPDVGCSATDNRADGPDAAVIFDSSCAGGCTGGDADLITPGDGPGNDAAQGNVLIIADAIADDDGDGLVDDPGDDRAGGIIEFTFQRPYKVYSLRILDIEPREALSHIELDLTDGRLQVIALDHPGDNSAQTVSVADPEPATALRVVMASSGAIDDIVVGPACGDGVIDFGEVCDPPDGLTCGHDCIALSSCTGDGTAAIREGASCSDGDDLCTIDDTCRSGACVGKSVCVAGCERCDEGSCTSLCGNPHRQDVDEITISDALFNLRASVALEDCTLCSCDVNNDDQITAFDTLLTLRSIVRLPTVFDCPDYVSSPQQ